MTLLFTDVQRCENERTNKLVDRSPKRD